MTKKCHSCKKNFAYERTKLREAEITTIYYVRRGAVYGVVGIEQNGKDYCGACHSEEKIRQKKEKEDKENGK